MCVCVLLIGSKRNDENFKNSKYEDDENFCFQKDATTTYSAYFSNFKCQ